MSCMQYQHHDHVALSCYPVLAQHMIPHAQLPSCATVWKASQELAWCSEYGDRASFMNDVKQAWEQRETLLETDLSRVK